MSQVIALDLLSGCHIVALTFVILVPKESDLRKSCYDGFDGGGLYYIEYTIS